jgi:hypothetical protein
VVAVGVQIDERELNFIILHYLRNGPSREAAQVLEQQLTQQGLLPRRVDFEGDHHFSLRLWVGIEMFTCLSSPFRPLSVLISASIFPIFL